MKLRGQFSVPIVLIIILTVSTVGLASFLVAQASMTELANNGLEQVTEGVFRNLSLFAEEIQHDTQSGAALIEKVLEQQNRTDAKAGAVQLESELGRLLSGLKKQFGYPESLFFVDARGIEYASSDPKGQNRIDISGSDEFLKAQAGQLVFSHVSISQASGNVIFMSAAPVYVSGTLSGVFVVPIPVDAFAKPQLASIRMGRQGYAYMVGPEGRIIAHPDKSLIMKLNLNDYDWGRTILAKKNGQIGYTFQGVAKQVAFRTLEALGWTVAVTANDRDIYSSTFTMGQLTFWLVLASILVGLAVVLWLVTSVTRELGKTVAFAGQVSRGRFDVDVGPSSLRRRDELGELAGALHFMIGSFREKAKAIESVARGNLDFVPKVVGEEDALGHSLQDMVDALNDVLNQVRMATDQVNSGSGQISMASQTISQGATEQAATLEQISASLVQVAVQAKENSSQSTEAVKIADLTAGAASVGTKGVEALYQSMTAIRDSARGIQSIVKLIDDIAFQINLLSLNAGVEAARAGKYGRGFAVVAEEVRHLAKRSADAVKETSTVAESAVKDIEAGFVTAKEVLKEIQEIAQQAYLVKTILEGIARASAEQATAVDETSNAVSQIGTVTQANTATAEQTASAAEELSSQAQLLQDLVHQFTLREQSSDT